MVYRLLSLIGYALRWLLSGMLALTAVTLWAVAQPLSGAMPPSGDAVLVVATTPFTIETRSQLANLLQAGAAPIAYLAGPQAEFLATDLVQRGVPSERLRILAEPVALIAAAHTAGHRRVIVAAPPAYRLAFVRRLQTVGFAVTVIEGEPPSLSERLLATLIYWQTMLVGRIN